MKDIIKELAKKKLNGFNIVDIKETGGEAGAYYGSIILSNHEGFEFSTGYVFSKPSNLSLTNSLEDIGAMYTMCLYKKFPILQK